MRSLSKFIITYIDIDFRFLDFETYNKSNRKVKEAYANESSSSSNFHKCLCKYFY